MDTNQQSEKEEKPDSGKGPDESKLPDGIGYGEVVSLTPAVLKVFITKNMAINKGDNVHYVATFEPELGVKYFFDETARQDIVVLLSGGRGIVISTPPPGIIKVSQASSKHARNTMPSYQADFVPYKDYYEFYDLPGNDVWLVR